MLTKQTVLHYLLQRGLTTPKAVVAGQVRILCSASRNDLFWVSQPQCSDIILKQPRPETTAGAATLWTEATCYWLVRHGGVSGLAPFVPRLVDYDYARKVLITESVGRACDAQKHHQGREAIDGLVTKMAAEALAAIHVDVSQQISRTDARRLFRAQSPWIANIADDEFPFRSTEVRIADFVGRVHRDRGLRESVVLLRSSLETSALIHGDVKWPNLLVCQGKSGPSHVVLVDWELACLGDPLWDVAGFLGSLLAFGLRTGRRCSEEVVRFWSSYAARAGIRHSREEALMIHSLRLTGLRLLQTCFEIASADGDPGVSDTMLATARRLMTSPERVLD